MLLEALKTDPYLKTLFNTVPKITEFEFHKFELDLQNKRLMLTVHTPVLPDKMPSKGNNFSAITLAFFMPRNLQADLQSNEILPMDFSIKEEASRLEVHYQNNKVLAFEYSFYKLEKWSLYLREE